MLRITDISFKSFLKFLPTFFFFKFTVYEESKLSAYSFLIV